MMNFLTDFYNDFPKIYICLLILFLLIAFIGFDCFLSNSCQIRGRIQDKIFSPGKVAVGVGPTSGQNGTTTTVLVTATSDEYILLIATENNVVKVNTNSSKWSKLNISDDIIFFKKCGFFTNMVYGYSLI